MRLIVLAESVDVETDVGTGRARVDFYRGQALPDDIGDEDRERLFYFGHVAEVDDAPPPPPEFDPATLGQATIEATLIWVGDDKTKAQQALDAETANGGKNRTTAIAALTAILAKE